MLEHLDFKGTLEDKHSNTVLLNKKLVVFTISPLVNYRCTVLLWKMDHTSFPNTQE